MVLYIWNISRCTIVLFLEVEFSVFTMDISLDVCVFQSKLHSARAAVYNKSFWSFSLWPFKIRCENMHHYLHFHPRSDLWVNIISGRFVIRLSISIFDGLCVYNSYTSPRWMFFCFFFSFVVFFHSFTSPFFFAISVRFLCIQMWAIPALV